MPSCLDRLAQPNRHLAKRSGPALRFAAGSRELLERQSVRRPLLGTAPTSLPAEHPCGPSSSVPPAHLREAYIIFPPSSVPTYLTSCFSTTLGFGQISTC